MNNFIKTQYKLYISGNKSIGIEKIKLLAKLYMSEEDQKELFKEQASS